MAKDITVNITANAPTNNWNAGTDRGNNPPSVPPAGGSVNASNNAFNNTTQNLPQPTNSNGNTTAIPTYDRMAQDIRREILSRGALMVPGSSNFQQLMTIVQQQKQNEAYASIEGTYRQKSVDLQTQKALEEEALRKGIEESKQRRISNYGGNPNDPLFRSLLDREANDDLNRGLKRLNDKYAPEFDKLDTEELSEKKRIDQDLVKIASELVQELRKGNPDSYLGRLRQQHKEAIWRRDNAETKEEAQAAGAEASDIQRRMTRAMAPPNRLQQTLGVLSGVGQVVNFANQGINAWRQNTLSQIGEINSAANGDIFGAMQQDLERRRLNASAIGGGIGTAAGAILGSILAGYSSGGVGTVAGAGYGAAVGGGIGTGIGNAIFNWTHAGEEREIKLGSMWQQQEQRIQRYNELALAARNRNEDLSFRREDFMYLMSPASIKSRAGDNLNYYDLGYTGSQFSNVVAQRIKQRGFIDNSGYSDYNIVDYATKQVALERAYNMSEGSLSQLSAYDRYGNNANQDMANLIASLSKHNTLGMRGGQSLRANEFLGYQTQLMEMQKGWMTAPNANYATRLLLAAQDAYGNNLDSRAINQIGNMENAVTNVNEDYSKAILYDTIQDLFPDTKGNYAAIQDKIYSNNPEDRAKIQQEIVKRLESIYGDIDTSSGRIAFESFYREKNINILKPMVEAYKKGLPYTQKGDVSKDVNSVKGYTPEVSKSMLEYQDKTALNIYTQLGNLENIGGKLLLSFNEKLDELIKKF